MRKRVHAPKWQWPYEWATSEPLLLQNPDGGHERHEGEKLGLSTAAEHWLPEKAWHDVIKSIYCATQGYTAESDSLTPHTSHQQERYCCSL